MIVHDLFLTENRPTIRMNFSWQRGEPRYCTGYQRGFCIPSLQERHSHFRIQRFLLHEPQEEIFKCEEGSENGNISSRHVSVAAFCSNEISLQSSTRYQGEAFQLTPAAGLFFKFSFFRQHACDFMRSQYSPVSSLRRCMIRQPR